MTESRPRVIADATFGPSSAGVRALRFRQRASIPLDAACVVAQRVGDALRELLGDQCDLVLGEPVAIGAETWQMLARDALLFLTRGGQTDIVLVLPLTDARRLVLRAFGEHEPGAADLPSRACSALELHALERIAARCAVAFEPLAAPCRGEARCVPAVEAPTCSAYFDLRVRAPISLSLGIGIVREPPQPAPSATLVPAALEAVTLDARAVFAEGMIDAADFMTLRPGDVVRLETKVGAPASLKCGPRRLAMGVPGVVASRAALLVQDVASGALL